MDIKKRKIIFAMALSLFVLSTSFAFASEDIPPANYLDPFTKIMPSEKTPGTYSVEDYQDMNDSMAIPKNKPEGPALGRDNGEVTVDNELEDERDKDIVGVELQSVLASIKRESLKEAIKSAEEKDIEVSHEVEDLIRDSIITFEDVDEETEEVDADITGEELKAMQNYAAGEEAVQTAAEAEGIENPNNHPDTGKAEIIIPLFSALMAISAVPFIKRKKKV